MTPREEYNHPHTAMAGYVGCGCEYSSDSERSHGEVKEEEESVTVYTIQYTNTSIHARLSRMPPAAELKLAYEPYDAARTLTSFDLGYA